MSRTRICAMRYFILLCKRNYWEILDTMTYAINAFFADYGINSDMWMHIVARVWANYNQHQLPRPTMFLILCKLLYNLTSKQSLQLILCLKTEHKFQLGQRLKFYNQLYMENSCSVQDHAKNECNESCNEWRFCELSTIFLHCCEANRGFLN